MYRLLRTANMPGFLVSDLNVLYQYIGPSICMDPNRCMYVYMIVCIYDIVASYAIGWHPQFIPDTDEDGLVRLARRRPAGRGVTGRAGVADSGSRDHTGY